MPTLSELLVALSRLPGVEAERFTTGVQALPPSGSYVGVAAGADAGRQVVSTDLADLDLAGDGSDTDGSWHDGEYLWLPSLLVQRRVADGGFAPNAAASSATDQGASSERVAVLTLQRKIGQTVPAGTVAELHHPLPPMYDADKKISLRSWLNRALDTMKLPVRVTLTGVQNAYRYLLSPSLGLSDEGDLIRVSDREYLTDQDPYVLPGTSGLRFDGANAYLTIQTPIAPGYPFYVDVYLRRKRWIAVTATGAAQLVGSAVSSVSILRGGTYTTAPTVTFTPTNGGSGATATAVLVNGTVASIQVTNGGSGYNAPPLVTFSAGDFALSTVGLVNLDDACTGPEEDIALLAYYFLCRELAHRDGQGTDAHWEGNAERVAAACAPYLSYGQPTGPTVRSVDRGPFGDSPLFLRRRGGGGMRRWG